MILSPYFKETLMNHLFSTASFAPEALYIGLFMDYEFEHVYVNRYAVHSSFTSPTEASDEKYTRDEIEFIKGETKIEQSKGSFFLPLTQEGTVDYYDCWFVADAEVGGNVLLLGYFDDTGDASYNFSIPGDYVSAVRGDTYGIKLHDLEISSIGSVYADISNGFIMRHALLSAMTHFLCEQEYTFPNTYIALLYEMPNKEVVDASDLSEISGTGYQRIKVNPAGGEAPAWNLAVSGEISNSGEIIWSVGGSDWSEIVGSAVVTEETGGEVLAVNGHFGSFTPESGRQIKFLSESLIFSL